MQQAITALLRQSRLQAQQLPQLVLPAVTVRSAHHEVVPTAVNPFLRFSTPFPKAIDHSPLLSTLPETQVTTLPNGLRVATESIPFAETASVGLYINAGSRFETDATNGAAHFLEHVLFKGTKKRSAKDLELEVESLGGKLGASTGRELTSYYAQGVLGKDLGKAVGILSDVLLNANLDDKTVDKARAAVLNKIDHVNKSSSDLVFDHLHATAFQYSPLGRTVIGPVENIKSFTKDQLQSYMKANYRGPRMVLAAAGAVNHEELVKLASDAFGSVPDEEPSSSVRALITKEPAKYTGSYVHDRFPDATECALAVAFRGAAWTDPDSIPLLVAQHILGSWDKSNTVGKHAGSQLTQTVSIEGLADSFSAFSTNYQDVGLFGVYGVTDRNRCEDFAWAIMHETTKMCYEVNEDDVARAKNQLKASLILAQDSTTSVAESIGRDLLVYGRRLPKAELFARIDAVDASAIRGVADRFIYDQDMVVASAGDVQFMPDYNFFRRRSYWLRY